MVVEFLKEKAKFEQSKLSVSKRGGIEEKEQLLEENTKQQQGVLWPMQRQSEAQQHINRALLVLIQKSFRASCFKLKSRYFCSIVLCKVDFFACELMNWPLRAED